MSTPTTPGVSASRRGENILERIGHFWRRISEGRQIDELWSQFNADARASYGFYMKEADAEELGTHRGFKRWFRIAKTLFWSLLMKLTPARRVLLLAAFVMLVMAGLNFFDVKFEIVAAALFLLLLSLELADKVTMKRDLEIAREIQTWLVPSQPPVVPGADLAFTTRPQNSVAGDYYDAFYPNPDEQERLMVVIADVAGKSIPAALLMATFQAGLKTLSATPCTLAELVAGMNRYASTNSQGGRRFTTAFVAEYDSRSRTLTYINAGHNTPILRRSSGAIERLTHGGLPFGIQADAPYESGSVNLQPGDWLVIFTDGVVEALNAKGEEYEESRLLNVLQNGITATPEELLRRLMADLDAFVGTTPQHDDVTCMLIKVS
jgi:sigma-B regulation protein RsbU (phosphoserine phosphatase)